MPGTRSMIATIVAIGVQLAAADAFALWPWSSAPTTVYYPTAAPVYSTAYYRPFAAAYQPVVAGYQPYVAGYAPYTVGYQPYGAGYVGASSYAASYQPVVATPVIAPRIAGYWPLSAYRTRYAPPAVVSHYPTTAYLLSPQSPTYTSYQPTIGASCGCATSYAPATSYGPTTTSATYAAPSGYGATTYSTSESSSAIYLSPSGSSSSTRAAPGSTAPSLLESPTPAESGSRRSIEPSASQSDADESESRMRPLINRTFEDGSTTRPAATPRMLDDKDLTAARPIRQAANTSAKPVIKSDRGAPAERLSEPTRWRSVSHH